MKSIEKLVSTQLRALPNGSFGAELPFEHTEDLGELITALEAEADVLPLEELEGIHAIFKTGRSEQAVQTGETPKLLLPHQQSQRQPVVRMHPETGKRALFLCEGGQMDWILGPFVGMEPGPDGDGAKLLYELMSHFTQPEFIYVHEWEEGDLVIHDNRSLIHCGTWYDAAKHHRLMWRTTVMGNPGKEYAGEKKSWIPESNIKPIAGLEY